MSKFTVNLNANVTAMRGWFGRKTCTHPVEHQDFVRNIYGEEIFHAGGMRSVWKCRDCGKDLYRPATFPEKGTVDVR